MVAEKVKVPIITEEIQHEYSTDVTRIGVSERTVVFDFGRITPFKNEIKYQVRVFMSPEHFLPFVELVEKFAEKYQPKKEEKK